MPPLLRRVGDGQEHDLGDLREGLADEAGLTSAEREELLPSGRQPTYHNRVHWAKTYLQKAGLVESPARGRVRITPEGRRALDSGVSRIDDRYLARFPAFVAFKGRKVASANPTPAASTPQQGTPDEELEALYRRLRAALAEELIGQAMRCSPAFLERLVVELLVAMGYGGTVEDAGRAVGKAGDDGVDGIIKQDRLGLDNIYLQAKRWTNPVGGPEVRNFPGSLAFHKASKGVLLTTSGFTKSALETARQLGNIVLIDGGALAEYMMDYGVGVATAARYEVKRIDRDYFEEP